MRCSAACLMSTPPGTKWRSVRHTLYFRPSVRQTQVSATVSPHEDTLCLRCGVDQGSLVLERNRSAHLGRRSGVAWSCRTTAGGQSESAPGSRLAQWASQEEVPTGWWLSHLSTDTALRHLVRRPSPDGESSMNTADSNTLSGRTIKGPGTKCWRAGYSEKRLLATPKPCSRPTRPVAKILALTSAISVREGM